MYPTDHNRPLQRGSTLIELSLSLTVLALVLGMGLQIQKSGREVMARASRQSDQTTKARHALELMSAELELLGRDHLFPQPDGDLGLDDFYYRRLLGMEEGEQVWSSLHRLAFEYEPGELDDGLDNDGDGLVDEGRLVLTRGVGDPEEQRTILCRGVDELYEGELANGEDDNGNGLIDEPGFHLTADGELLRLRISLLRPHPTGVERETVETALGPRN